MTPYAYTRFKRMIVYLENRRLYIFKSCERAPMNMLEEHVHVLSL